MGTIESKPSKKTNKPKFSAQKTCIDKVTPKQFNNAVQNLPTSAIFEKSTIWRPGQKGKILISFNENDGAWSYPGSYSNEFSLRGSPSMNLGWLDPPFTSFIFLGKTYSSNNFDCEYRNGCCDINCPSVKPCLCSECPPNEPGYRCPNNFVPGSVVLHEFGHALGMMHEHQADLFKTNKLEFNKAAVVSDPYCYNKGCSDCSYNYVKNCLENNTCDACVRGAADMAQTQVLDRYQCTKESCDYAGSRFDNKSVMKYWFPDSWFVSGNNPDPLPNYTLSEKDKEWISGFYPRKSRGLSEYGFPEITVEFVGGSDWQKAWVQKVVSEQIAPLTGIKWIMPDIIIDPHLVGSVQNRKTDQVTDVQVPMSSLNIAIQNIKNPELDDRLRVDNSSFIKEQKKRGKVIEGFRRNSETFRGKFSACEIFGIIVAVLVFLWLCYLIANRNKK